MFHGVVWCVWIWCLPTVTCCSPRPASSTLPFTQSCCYHTHPATVYTSPHTRVFVSYYVVELEGGQEAAYDLRCNSILTTAVTTSCCCHMCVLLSHLPPPLPQAPTRSFTQSCCCTCTYTPPPHQPSTPQVFVITLYNCRGPLLTHGPPLCCHRLPPPHTHTHRCLCPTMLWSWRGVRRQLTT
jgi:hypothetical protein